MLELLNQCKILSEFPKLKQYVKRTTAREHWKTAHKYWINATMTGNTEIIGTLFYWWGSGSSRAHFLALEMGLKLNYRMVNLPNGEHKTDQFKKETNGAQTLPVFMSHDKYLTDSIEIVNYLVDQFDKDNRFKCDRLEEWSQYAKNVDDVVLKVYLHTKLLPQLSRNQNLLNENIRIFDTKIAHYLIQGLGENLYFGGDKISATDCILATILSIAKSVGLLEKHDPLNNYMERISKREHFIKSHIPFPNI